MQHRHRKHQGVLCCAARPPSRTPRSNVTTYGTWHTKGIVQARVSSNLAQRFAYAGTTAAALPREPLAQGPTELAYTTPGTSSTRLLNCQLPTSRAIKHRDGHSGRRPPTSVGTVDERVRRQDLHQQSCSRRILPRSKTSFGKLNVCNHRAGSEQRDRHGSDASHRQQKGGIAANVFA